MDRLKVIGTFVQIARSRSLSRAAGELGISTALASSHLKQLEQHLGVRLVNRTTRRLALTDAGQEYLTFCTDVLDRFEAQEMDVIESHGGPAGNLKITGSPAFVQIEVMPVVARFTHIYPKIRISILLSDPSFSPGEFVEGGYDLGIATHAISDARLVATKIADIAWVLCCAPEYLKIVPPPGRPQELKDHNCLVHRAHAPDAKWRLICGDETHDISVSGSLVTNSSEILRASVLSGTGIAMLPLYSMRDDLEQGRLVPLLTEYDSGTRPAYVVYPDGGYLPKRTRLFVDFLRRELKPRKPQIGKAPIVQKN